MPPSAASPAIRLSADGVTYGAPGVKVAVAAGGTVYAKLDSIANVNQVAWDVAATDGSALPSSFVITTSGVVPGGNQATITALGLGTAGRLRATVNAGVGAYGNVDLTTTQRIVKWFVLAATGREVGTVGEGFESDAVNGTAPLINAAITNNNGAGPLVSGSLSIGSQTPPQIQVTPQTTVTTKDNATTTIGTIPIAPGSCGRLRLIIQATIRGANAGSWVISTFENVVFFAYPTGGTITTAAPGLIAAGTLALGPLFGGGMGQGIPSLTVSGSNIVVAATGPVAATAYSHNLAVAGLAPNATGISVVSNGGNLYLVTTGGTTAASGSGPTGTSAGNIPEGGGSPVGYAYLCPAAAGIVVDWTLLLPELASG